MADEQADKDMSASAAETDAADDIVTEVDVSADQLAADRKKVEQFKGEIGGRKGPEPTRYGDWESKGRCTDF